MKICFTPDNPPAATNNRGVSLSQTRGTFMDLAVPS
jgi:hypothetical protein